MPSGRAFSGLLGVGQFLVTRKGRQKHCANRTLTGGSREGDKRAPEGAYLVSRCSATQRIYRDVEC